MAQLPLDSLDLRIVAELQDDGRRSYRDLAESLGVSPGTVRTRLGQLLSDGIVEVIAVPNPWSLGYRFLADLGISLEPGYSDEAAERLAERPEVSWLAMIVSPYDIFAEVVLRDAQAFGRFKQEVLATLPGFRSVDVFQAWDVRKFHYRLDVSSNGEGIATDATVDAPEAGQ
jgi:Lrp/AsnC family transcriptional regulator for asnA, asnC and gidA